MAANLIGSYTIPGNPVSKGRPRTIIKNGRPLIYADPASRKAEEAAKKELTKQVPPGYLPTSLPLDVTIRFYKSDHMRRDGDNLQKLVQDAGNGILWMDDSQIKHYDITIIEPSKAIVIDNPRTELEVRLWQPAGVLI